VAHFFSLLVHVQGKAASVLDVAVDQVNRQHPPGATRQPWLIHITKLHKLSLKDKAFGIIAVARRSTLLDCKG